MLSKNLSFWGITDPIDEGKESQVDKAKDEQQKKGKPKKFSDLSEHCLPDDEGETLRQFLLDVPRMEVFVDTRLWKGKPQALYDYLFKILPHWGANLASEFCTQTALAPFFCCVKETLEPDTHFVDGGRQHVKINSKQRTLNVEKPFKVVDFDTSLNARVLFVVTLVVEVNLETGKVDHHFNRSSVVEQDWVYVEELCDEDEIAFRDGAGAEDIAASALRMQGSS